MTTKNGNIDAGALADKFFKEVTFGRYIKSMRESDEVSQSELARRIGVTRQFLNAVEAGKRAGNIDLAVDIAKALGYPEFLFLEVCFNDLLRRKGIAGSVKVDLKNNAA
jgi:DNA-binding XRE family transcriptional regulator